MDKYSITERQREQAERMAEMWEARALEFFDGDTIRDYNLPGFFKTADEAFHALENATRIKKALERIQGDCGTRDDDKVILEATTQDNQQYSISDYISRIETIQRAIMRRDC